MLQRTATGNGASSIEQLAQWLGLRAENQPVGHVAGHSKLVAALANEAGGHSDFFMAAFFSKTGGFTQRQPLKMMLASVPPAWIRGNERSVCPTCVSEGWSKAIHDLKFVDACPYHGVALLSHCPSCQTPLNWVASRFDRCAECKSKLEAAELIWVDSHGASRVLHYLRTGDNARLQAVVKALSLMGRDRIDESEARNAALNLAVRVVECEPEALATALQDGAARSPGLPLAAIATPWLVSEQVCLQQNVLSILESLKTTFSHGNCASCKCNDETFTAAQVMSFLKVSAATLRKLVSAQLLSRRRGPGPRQWVYDKATLCRLLSDLAPTKTNRQGESLMQRGVGSGALIDRILAIKAGHVKVLHVDWFRGLSGVDTEPFPRKPTVKPQNALSVTDAAARLGTYADAVRRAVKAGRLSAFSTAATSNAVWISEAALNAFDRKFVFLTTLAKQVGAGRTILSTKLEHIGVLPVSGPRVDAGLVPIYRRRDLANVDLAQIAAIQQFATRTGRKKGDPDCYAATEWMPSQQVATLLKLTAHQLSPLVVAGLLEVGIPPGREADNRRYYRHQSVLSTVEWIGAALAVHSFVKTIGLSEREFHVRFTRSGRVNLIQVGAIKMIGAEDIKFVEEDVAQYVTCEQASRALGAPQKHFLNLVRTDRFDLAKPHRRGDPLSLMLLRRSDVEAYADSFSSHRGEVFHA